MKNTGISNVEKYLELCKANSVENTHLRGYRHELLEELMHLPIFDEFYKQLKKHERQAIREYLKYLKHGQEWGFFKATIPLLEEAVQALSGLYQKELNARWVIRDRATGLYWCSPLWPWWGKQSRALLFFTEKQAKQYAEVTNRTLGKRRLEVQKIDATTRLKRWARKHQRTEE